MIRRLHVPLLKPEDVIPHLAKPDLHWKSGYSAQVLAIAWVEPSNDFPPAYFLRCPNTQTLNWWMASLSEKLNSGRRAATAKPTFWCSLDYAKRSG